MMGGVVLGRRVGGEERLFWPTYGQSSLYKYSAVHFWVLQFRKQKRNY